MAFRVYLLYSLDPTEQAIAWRLQTLAAAHGIEMYVPQRNSVGSSQLEPPAGIRKAIEKSDCVLAIIATKPNSAVQKELKYALNKSRLVIPIVHAEVVADRLLSSFPKKFVFSPWESPATLESEVMDFLKQQHQSKENRQAIGALVAVGVGLLLLSALSEK